MTNHGNCESIRVPNWGFNFIQIQLFENHFDRSGLYGRIRDTDRYYAL